MTARPRGDPDELDVLIVVGLGPTHPSNETTFVPRVESEVGRLESVIVHRPGLEIERLTPQNHDELLFDDLLSPTAAKREHDYFVEVMRDRGVQVLHFTDLLIETLDHPEARQYVLENTINRLYLGPLLAPAVEEWAAELDSAALASVCIEGLTLGDWQRVSPTSSLVAQTLAENEFLISPLPNHLFARDASAWIYGGVAINSMKRESRRREPLHYSAIYQWHPRFAGADFTRWTNGTSGPIRSVEGGDIMVLGDGLLAIGLSERTNPQGVERLASRLFAQGQADHVLAVMLPHQREFMHLDTVLTQVDRDSFIIYPPIRSARTISLVRDGDRPRLVMDDLPLEQALPRALGRPIRFIIPEGTEAELAREQWNDGFNMLALSPGQVVAYDRTPRSIRALEQAGIEVFSVFGSELGRGRGGPRCMSCPVRRAQV
ncbi:arginine deiminase [Scrofimicrobium sp. R131]|uniref:Arginine deiminase n=1 Tax=Scrofimicrobium appendicitidis TaxID=3079930 RepID=A0AAU7V9A2_9ACTO